MATDWKDALSALTGIERTETPNSTQQPTNTANTNKKNPTIDMAKTAIKSEKLTPFGGIFLGRRAI